MATTDLGRLEPVDLREVWPNEESDFTPWLADQKNLAILGDALGMPLEFVAREEAVGPYSADILCRDSNDRTQVVVENQLESTDHDHLGKLLTYAAHLGARVVVWIAKSFTDQHRAALDWLNEVSEAETRFFGLEIELWQIGESAPAPKFNVVAKPNDWTKERIEPTALTATLQMQLDFWKGFAEFVARKGKIVTKINSPKPQNWLGLSGVGRAGFYLYGVVSTRSETGGHELRAELVITGQDTDHYFDLLNAGRHDVEEEHEFSDKMEWYNPTGAQQRKIYWRLPTDFGDRDLRTDQYRWLLKRVEALHRILAPRVKALPVPE
ncbi:MAG: DUF4268 domain-containing protein [Gemmatimonadetes bacterium]|nr:DUF4268 domain-containing protein [Gemmatimonadota bacterium]